MLLAYYCEFCNLFFWLQETIIHELNELHFSENLHSGHIRCPSCRAYNWLSRQEARDVSSEEVAA